MPARPIGSATLSFGLVSVPVQLFSTAESSAGVTFNWLHKSCGSRLKQQYMCPKDNVKVERDDMVKGYEFSKGQYVLFTPDELKAMGEESTGAVDIGEFVPAEQVDRLWLDRAYFLGPDKGGERAYKLIRDAMLDTGLVCVASYSARGKQYIVCLRPFHEGLILHQLRYAQEVKPWTEVPMPDLPELKPQEIGLAKQIIQQIQSETFHPEKYKDEVQARMIDLINKKVEGHEITMQPEAPAGKVIDLMAALKASLGMAGKEDERKPAIAAEPKAEAAAEEAAPKKKASKKK